MSTFPYEDIIGLAHPTSVRHPRMDMKERAAQFSPFAALSGYGAAVSETARLTEEFHAPDEEQQAQLNQALTALSGRMASHPTATLTYFEPDEKKQGGCYRVVTARVTRLDAAAQSLTLEDGTTVPFARLSAISLGADE